jgi:hypothetical protein
MVSIPHTVVLVLSGHFGGRSACHVATDGDVFVNTGWSGPARI